MSPWTNPDQSYTSVITILCKWNDAYIALFYSWVQSALYNTHTLFSIFFYLSAFYLIFTLQRATQVQGSCPSKLWHTDCSSRGSNRQTFDLQMICCFSRATSRLLDVALDQHPNIYMLGCWFDHCSNTSSLMKRIKTSTDRAQSTDQSAFWARHPSLLHVQHHIYYWASISVLSLEATGCSKQKWTHLTVITINLPIRCNQRLQLGRMIQNDSVFWDPL